MSLKKDRKNFFYKLRQASKFFIFGFLAVVFLLFGTVKIASAVDGLMNGKTITGETDDFLFYLQTYDPATSPYFFNRLFVTKTGNVGIGSTNPGVLLDVNGYFRATGATISAIGSGIIMADSSGNLYSTSTTVATGIPSPSGISGQTLRSNGTSWVANSLLFNNGTNVGIGTTNPGLKLDANGPIGYPATSGSTQTGVFRVSQPGAVVMDMGIASASPWGGWIQVSHNSNLSVNYPLLLNPNGGNVGIGKPNPGANLDVLTSINAGSTVTGTGICIGASCLTTWPWLKNSTHAYFNDTGNVGIGTSSPAFKLDVAGVINATALYVNGSPYIGSQWTTQGTSIYYNTGNVGIGVTAPTVKLDNNGSFKSSLITTLSALGSGLGTNTLVMADTNGVLFSTSTAAVITANGLWSGTKNGAIWNGDAGVGNVGIGTTNPLASLDINGDLRIGNTVDACTTNKAGTFRYATTSRQTYFCDGLKWQNMRNCGLMTDDEGNIYGTVQIGGQCWMAENINIGTKLASGATEPNTTNGTIEKWCYNNSDANCTTYGGLYNWLEASRGSHTGGARGICPNGWHIPTDTEYNNLEKTVLGIIDSAQPQYVCDFNSVTPGTYYWRRCADDNGTDGGGVAGAGKSLKAIGQGTSNGAGNDLVGFGGLLSGARDTDGTFQVLGDYAYLWTSSTSYDVPSGNTYAWYRILYTSYSTIDRNLDLYSYGFAVRCVKD